MSASHLGEPDNCERALLIGRRHRERVHRGSGMCQIVMDGPGRRTLLNPGPRRAFTFYEDESGARGAMRTLDAV